jgi:hypothetical protein
VAGAYIHGSLLELYGVTTRVDSKTNQALGEIDIAIVIDTDLGNDETWLAVADQPVAQSDCSHGRLLE